VAVVVVDDVEELEELVLLLALVTDKLVVKMEEVDREVPDVVMPFDRGMLDELVVPPIRVGLIEISKPEVLIVEVVLDVDDEDDVELVLPPISVGLIETSKPEVLEDRVELEVDDTNDVELQLEFPVHGLRVNVGD